jgi:hypothetical protein
LSRTYSIMAIRRMSVRSFVRRMRISSKALSHWYLSWRLKLENLS